MKVVAVILVSFVITVLSIEEYDLLEEWNNFQVKYGKSYRSPLEARNRLAIFNNNLEHIHAHNALFRKGETTFTKGINEFADWTPEEFMQYLEQGLPKQPPTISSGKMFQKTVGFKSPESIDWREKGAVTEVKKQGGCGSCWSFSTTGTLEGQFSIQKNQRISLSEQNLVDCNKANGGCDGGWPLLALKFVKDYGIESEQDYPYQGEDLKCRNDSSKAYWISGYEQIPERDEEALQEAVATRGPVSICLYASDNFQSYESGILIDSTCSNMEPNHAVLIVGLGSENGQEYYIVKNSWGPQWGDSGYIKLARNHGNMCGLATNAVIPVL